MVDVRALAIAARHEAKMPLKQAPLGKYPFRRRLGRSVVEEHWRSYRCIALAAVLINMLSRSMPLFIMSVHDRVIPNGAIRH